jgi:RNA polymerase-binding transcription factor DksA
LPKSKKAAKKPQPKRTVVAKRPPKKAVKPAAPSRGVAKPAAKSAKPAPAKAVPVKAANAAKPGKAGKPVKPAKAIPAPIILPVLPKVEAPGKFRREYRRWKDLLISLRHRLLAEGSHLEEEGLKALEQEVSVDHMADFGSDSSEQETTLQLIESNSVSLRDVDDALKRIEARTYGLCEECESLIPPARLAVIPHARLCIGCQSKREGMPA